MANCCLFRWMKLIVWEMNTSTALKLSKRCSDGLGWPLRTRPVAECRSHSGCVACMWSQKRHQIFNRVGQVVRQRRRTARGWVTATPAGERALYCIRRHLRHTSANFSGGGGGARSFPGWSNDVATRQIHSPMSGARGWNTLVACCDPRTTMPGPLAGECRCLCRRSGNARSRYKH